jgi:hypothetical protein
MTTSSDKCRENSAEYICVLNGVWYRMNADMSGAAFKLVPEDLPPPAETVSALQVTKRRPPAMRLEPVPTTGSSPRAASFEDSTDDGKNIRCGASGMQENAVKVFNRDGAEPLRAGHPDLWHLLVAGTCLEGTTFQSG